MTHVFRKFLEYVPQDKTPLLASGKDINTSMVPYVMGEDQSWLELSFLMESDTAHLVRDLEVPDYRDHVEINKLVSFLRKRGMVPFHKLTIALDMLHAVCERLGPFYLESLQYDLSCFDGNFDMSFPNFTTDIKMKRGLIRNLPDRLVNLSLTEVQVPDSVMEAIGEARFLTSLHLEGDNIVLRGLPQFLEKLELISHYGIEFELQSAMAPAAERARPSVPALAGLRPAALEEDAHFHYDCQYLTHLEYRKTGHRGSSIILPRILVSCMTKSLTYLSIVGDKVDGESSFREIFSKLQNLQELHLGMVTIGNYPLPTSIKILRIIDMCDISYSDAFGSLPELTELYMPYELGFEPIAEHILRTSPQLKTLRMDRDETTGRGLVLPTGVFPQIEVLNLLLLGVRQTLVPLGANNKILNVFPNVTRIECRQTAHMWKADFSERKLYIESPSWLSAFPRREEGVISFEGTQFERFHLRLEGKELVSGRLTGFDIKLPLTTTEVTLTFEGYRKGPNEDLYPAHYMDINSIQYDIREITKNKKLGPLREIMIHCRTESGRIYPSITLDNETRITQVFGEYDPTK